MHETHFCAHAHWLRLAAASRQAGNALETWPIRYDSGIVLGRRGIGYHREAMGAERCSQDVAVVSRSAGPQLYLAWCNGEPRFAKQSLPPGN